MTLDKPNGFCSGIVIPSMKNEALCFLWGTWPVECKPGTAVDHGGERPPKNEANAGETDLGGRGSGVLMTVLLLLDPSGLTLQLIPSAFPEPSFS